MSIILVDKINYRCNASPMTVLKKSSAEPPASTTIFRRFNRTYTRFLRTFDKGLPKSLFSLAEARVLYELATREAPKASDMAEDLEIDRAYLSRILAKFERDGLLRRETSDQDGRSASLQLTARGKSAFKKLDSVSEAKARSILSDFAPAAVTELVRCMQSIDSILLRRVRSAHPLILRPHRVGDMGWVIYREAVGYAEQFGWDETFEALVAKIAAEFITTFDPVRERCWIAEIDGESVGHVFLVRDSAQLDTAKLRLLFVEPCSRGMGVGEALVNECVRFARSVGYRKVVLWTQSILAPAHRIYQRAGFRLVKEAPHHSFGHDLIGQDWELELR
jgi:DNA-binding MarR family transcriptional regulator/GNAT superfamily N-acetyltransferase